MRLKRDCWLLGLIGCTLLLAGSGCGSNTKASSRSTASSAGVGAATGSVSTEGVWSTGGSASSSVGGTGAGGTVGNGVSAWSGGTTGAGGTGTGAVAGHSETRDSGNLDAAPPTGHCSSSPLGGIGIPAGTVATGNASYTPSSTADLAIDGDMTTGWNSGDYSGWLKLQFPKPTQITAVQIVAGAKPTSDVAYTITSDSQATIGSGTRTVISGLANGSMLEPIGVTRGIYSSITITVSGGASWVQILELSLLNDECPRPGVAVDGGAVALDGGSTSRCTGTPSTSSCYSFDYTNCTRIPGCKDHTGQYHCQGVDKPPCSDYSTSATCTATRDCEWLDTGGSCSGSVTASCTWSNEPSCTKEPGCRWVSAANSCYNPGVCGISKTQDLCERRGCSWSSDTLTCTGIPAPCKYETSEDCVAAGCTWNPGHCGPYNCWEFTSEDLCSAAGCTWSHCKGSRRQCTSAYSQDTCESLGGCTWWALDSRCEGTPTPCAQLSAADCTRQPGCSISAP